MVAGPEGLSQGLWRNRWIGLSFKTWGTASSNVGDDHLNDLELDARLRSRPSLGQLPRVWGEPPCSLFLLDEAAHALPSVAIYTSNKGVILEIHNLTANKST